MAEENNEEITETQDEGLSLREALESAIEVHSDEEKAPIETKEVVEEPAAVVEAPPPEPAFNPPAEWSADEKADFSQGTRKQQEAALRLHRSRMSKLEEIKTASREYQDIKALADSINPYIKAMGIKESPQVALQKATALWKEFEYADNPKLAAAQYLKAKGIEPPPELLENQPQRIDVSDEKIKPLQDQINLLANRIAQEDRVRTESTLTEAWQSFEAQTDASGKPRYPDVKSTSGPQIAAKIGRLVSGQTEYSNQFIADAKERIPDLTYGRLLEEAYRFYGGQISDSKAATSQEAQNHLYKAKRASASKPSGAHSLSVNGATNKKLPMSEAIRAAWADLNSDN